MAGSSKNTALTPHVFEGCFMAWYANGRRVGEVQTCQHRNLTLTLSAERKGKSNVVLIEPAREGQYAELTQLATPFIQTASQLPLAECVQFCGAGCGHPVFVRPQKSEQPGCITSLNIVCLNNRRQTETPDTAHGPTHVRAHACQHYWHYTNLFSRNTRLYEARRCA